MNGLERMQWALCGFQNSAEFMRSYDVVTELADADGRRLNVASMHQVRDGTVDLSRYCGNARILPTTRSAESVFVDDKWPFERQETSALEDSCRLIPRGRWLCSGSRNTGIMERFYRLAKQRKDDLRLILKMAT